MLSLFLKPTVVVTFPTICCDFPSAVRREHDNGLNYSCSDINLLAKVPPMQLIEAPVSSNLLYLFPKIVISEYGRISKGLSTIADNKLERSFRCIRIYRLRRRTDLEAFLFWGNNFGIWGV